MNIAAVVIKNIVYKLGGIVSTLISVLLFQLKVIETLKPDFHICSMNFEQ